MKIKKELDVMTWKIIEKVIGAVIDVIFCLAEKYSKIVFQEAYFLKSKN